MLVVPTKAVPSQTLNVTLGNQAVTLRVYTLTTGLYMDVYVSNVLIYGGVICQDRKRIIRYPVLGFVGDLTFVDQQGTSDPTFDGLGTRYLLMYLEASDL